MKLFIRITGISLFALAAAACNTIEGAGEDIEEAGDEISETANEAKD
jgi:predicted small secreted protein